MISVSAAPSEFVALAKQLEQEVLNDIPITRTMQLRIAHADGQRIELAAPLAPNVNDKGCAFGGSLASVLTLAGWSLLVLRLRAADWRCEVYVQDSQIKYLAPVWDDFRAVATLAEGESWESFFASLESRGKGRLRVIASVATREGAPATTLDARFVAIRAKEA